MNVYIAFGTFDYLSKIKKSHPEECMLLMYDGDNCALMHITNKSSFFHEPKAYEVAEKAGKIDNGGQYAAFHYIESTEEGRPLFERHFKDRLQMADKNLGFSAAMILRPLQGSVYVIFTLWNSEKEYKAWQKTKPLIAPEDKLFISRPGYSKTYRIADEKTL